MGFPSNSGATHIVTVTDATQGVLRDVTQVSATRPSKLHAVVAYNGSASTKYLHFYDVADVDFATAELPDGTVPDMVVPVPTKQTASLDYGVSGRPLKLGAAAALSSTEATLTSFNFDDDDCKLELTYSK